MPQVTGVAGIDCRSALARERLVVAMAGFGGSWRNGFGFHCCSA
jgi:hypothetical protein